MFTAGLGQLSDGLMLHGRHRRADRDRLDDRLNGSRAALVGKGWFSSGRALRGERAERCPQFIIIRDCGLLA